MKRNSGFYAARRKPKCEICGKRFKAPTSGDRDTRHPNCHAGKCARALEARYKRERRRRELMGEVGEVGDSPQQPNPDVGALLTWDIGPMCRMVVIDKDALKVEVGEGSDMAACLWTVGQARDARDWLSEWVKAK